MRDLSKARLVIAWKNKQGKTLCEVREGKRGAKYVSFCVRYPGYPGVEITSMRDFRDMRLTQLKEACQMVGTELEEGSVGQDVAEKVLDLLYLEMGKRLKV